MKNVSDKFKNYFLYVGIFFLAVGLNSCSNDDDVPTPPEPTGSIVVQDQTTSQNQVMVDQVTISTNGFLVARHDTQTGTILAQENINQGTQDDITLQLDDQGAGVDLQDGDTVVLSLYADSNNDGNFNAGTDALLATENVVISSPTVSVADQPVVDNAITASNIRTGQDAFAVTFEEDEQGNVNLNDPTGTTFVQAGENQDVSMNFDENRTPAPGVTLQTRLFRDIDRNGIFNPEIDTPETFGFNDENQVVGRARITEN